MVILIHSPLDAELVVSNLESGGMTFRTGRGKRAEGRAVTSTSPISMMREIHALHRDNLIIRVL